MFLRLFAIVTIQKVFESIYFKVQHEITSWKGSKRNSSVFITSWKFWSANLCERLCNSLQAWVSVIKKLSTITLLTIHFRNTIILFYAMRITFYVPAKLRIPKQLVGCSCLIRNLQLASLTVAIWSIEDAGSNTLI